MIKKHCIALKELIQTCRMIPMNKNYRLRVEVIRRISVKALMSLEKSHILRRFITCTCLKHQFMQCGTYI